MFRLLDVQFAGAALTAPYELHPIATCCLHQAGLDLRLDVVLLQLILPPVVQRLGRTFAHTKQHAHAP